MVQKKVKAKSDRPEIMSSKDVLQVIMVKPSNITKRVSDEYIISQPSVVLHLHDLSKITWSCQIVPHKLTPAQAQRQVDICKELFENLRDLHFFKRIIT